MSPYPNHFPSKILNNFIPLFPGYPRIRENFLTRRERSRRRSSRRGGELSSIRGRESGKWKDHLRRFHRRIHRFLVRSYPSFFEGFRGMFPARMGSLGSSVGLPTGATGAMVSGVIQPVTGVLDVKRVCHWGVFRFFWRVVPLGTMIRPWPSIAPWDRRSLLRGSDFRRSLSSFEIGTGVLEIR